MSSLYVHRINIRSEKTFTVSILELDLYIKDKELTKQLTDVMIKSFDTHLVGATVPGEIFLLMDQKNDEPLIVSIIFTTPTVNGDYIYNVCTHPLHRSKGYMTQLLNYLISMKSNSLFLDVSMDNRAALELYYKLGFVKWGEKPGAYLLRRDP